MTSQQRQDPMPPRHERMRAEQPDSRHRPVDRDAGLGYTRLACASCGGWWPCHDEILRRCEVHHLAVGLPCDCGWHDADGNRSDSADHTPV
jgi:hypothetical protein